MRDILSDIDRWHAAGERVAVATVVRTWGSAPRAVGAKMAMTPDGKIAGSVSGGCVEAAVVEAAAAVLDSGLPRLLQFGVTDEKAWEVGLACGGEIGVFVEPLDESLLPPLRAAADSGRPYVLCTVVDGSSELLGRKLLLTDDGRSVGPLSGALAERASQAARAALREAASRQVELATGEGNPCGLFIEVVLPAPTLVAVGGVHIAIALTSIARTLGYRTVVVDPRRFFGNKDRFPNADLLIESWPDEGLRQIGLDSSTAVAVLTHDPKLDDPALRAALASPAFYVGALGSRATQEKRRRRLLEAGVPAEQLARLHAPIGLDLGGRSPEEIALAVMAQIVAVRNTRATAATPLARAGSIDEDLTRGSNNT